MYSQNKSFQHRMAEVEARRRGADAKRARVLYRKRPDGLLVPVVINEARRVPWLALVFVAASLIAIKGFLYAYFGAEIVETRVEGLWQGEWYNQLYAFLLWPEPVSAEVARWISTLLPNLKI